jgi:hypothetical protein
MKLLILLLAFPVLVAAQGFGIATLVKGSPIVEHSAGSKKPLAKGDKVFESDTIVTSANSLVRLVMMDTNVIDIYPNSKVLIKEYIYKPKENQKNVSLEVTEGRIKSTVKQKYDNDKNKFNVKTPVIVAGVRGTIFFTGHELKSGLSHVLTQEGNVMVGKIEANQQVKEFFSVKANQKIEIKDKQVEQPKVQEVPKADIDKQKKEDKSAGFAKSGQDKGADEDRVQITTNGQESSINHPPSLNSSSVVGSGSTLLTNEDNDGRKLPNTVTISGVEQAPGNAGSGNSGSTIKTPLMQEQPEQDRPKQDRPKQDRPKQDRPKQDRPKQDRPKPDTPRPGSGEKHGESGGGKNSGNKNHGDKK